MLIYLVWFAFRGRELRSNLALSSHLNECFLMCMRRRLVQKESEPPEGQRQAAGEGGT